jgi:hypothetical protein
MDVDTAGRTYQDESQLTQAINVDGNDLDNDHELKTAPLLTRGAYRTKKMRQAVGQYGVFGTIAESKYDDSDPKTSFLIFVGYLIFPRRCKTMSSLGCTLTRQVTLLQTAILLFNPSRILRFQHWYVACKDQANRIQCRSFSRTCSSPAALPWDSS